MSVLYSFYTEIIIFYAIVYLFFLGLGLRSFWSHPGFSPFIFNQLILVLVAILCALCVSEGH